MVTQSLTKRMTDDGAALLRQLDDVGLNITAAFWFYLESSDVWTLVLTSPDVEKQGPKSMYSRIQKALPQGSSLSVRDVTVLPSDDPIAKLLRVAMKTGPKDVAGIRFSRNTINGHVIEDAYIYRLA